MSKKFLAFLFVLADLSVREKYNGSYQLYKNLYGSLKGNFGELSKLI